MKTLLDYVSTVTDTRQEKKVLHKMMDIIMIVFFATLANADDWVEMEVFGKEHEKFLRNYLELPNGIPSHDTIQRVFAIVPSEFLKECAYKKTVEKARGKIEKREYWQTEDISWLSRKKEWAGLKTIILTRNTVTGEEGEEYTEERYFISSLLLGIEAVARAVRGHWMVESYHWNLDVTFREDGNHTLEKQAAYNLNIIRKLSLNILKLVETGNKALSIKKKRYAIGTNPEKHIERIMNL